MDSTFTLPDGTVVTLAELVDCSDHQPEPVVDLEAQKALLGDHLGSAIVSMQHCTRCGAVEYTADLGAGYPIPGVRCERITVERIGQVMKERSR